MSEREKRDRSQGIPIWKRERDGIWRADLRRYEGGGRESLGTRDRTEAERVLADRIRELEAEEAQRAARESGDPLLEDFVQDHLDRKRNEVADSTWTNHERALGYLTTFLNRRLPRKPRLSDVTARRLSDYIQHRLQTVKASTVNSEMSAVSSMLRRAHDWNLVARNEARHVRAPKPEITEAAWLETGEAAKALGVAGEMEADPASRCYSQLRAVLATFLLTGGRKSEVYGLERDDVDLENGVVHIRPNEWRSLKTRHSKRTVPLWPQLREILAPYLAGRDDDRRLLFPSRTGRPMYDLRSSWDTIQERAKLDTRLTPKVFRHTYTATRIQTMDGGEPVSLFTVARELGHRGIERIESVYGHLSKRRSRLPEVRYREAKVIPMEEKRGA